MKLAVIGARGMLGQEFLRLSPDATGFHRDNLNLEGSAGELAAQLDGYDAILNCVAYTAVDKAESDEQAATHANAEIPARLATAALATGAHLVHFSTDYVFDGSATAPYSTDSPRNPQNAYGRSKAAGEAAIEASGADFTIVRTAWLYGEFGKCFPKTIATLLETRGHLNIVADQHGQPTWTRDLAHLSINLLGSGNLLGPGHTLPTHLHGVSSGQGTWFDFASEIAQSLGMDPATALTPVGTADFPTPASRPAFSVLDNSIPAELGVAPIGDWRDRWHAAATAILAAR
jgi:dTDP-4-dehydrorhamnose reductase